MRPNVRRRILTLALISLTAAIFSLGCVAPRTTADTSWVRPLYLEQDSVDWLLALPEWPASFSTFLNEVDRHNTKVQEINP
jgi:hypothetical protein